MYYDLNQVGCQAALLRIAIPWFLQYRDAMRNLAEIENAIRGISRKEKAAFRAWYAECDSAEWDRQIEEDVAAGRLDWLSEEGRQYSQQSRIVDY